jgi:hypothetical protein
VKLRIGVCWSIFQRPRQPINRSPQRPSSKDRRADQYVVNCDEDDAKSLLAAAEHDCPTAVQPIKAGLIAAQARKERDR